MSPLERALLHPRRALIQHHIVRAEESVAPHDAAAALGMATASVCYHLEVLAAADAPLGFDSDGRVWWTGD